MVQPPPCTEELCNSLFQIGENYYLPMTSYLETKTGASSDVPGPLCFSERISLHPLSGTR